MHTQTLFAVITNTKASATATAAYVNYIFNDGFLSGTMSTIRKGPSFTAEALYVKQYRFWLSSGVNLYSVNITLLMEHSLTNRTDIDVYSLILLLN